MSSSIATAPCPPDFLICRFCIAFWSTVCARACSGACTLCTMHTYISHFCSVKFTHGKSLAFLKSPGRTLFPSPPPPLFHHVNVVKTAERSAYHPVISVFSSVFSPSHPDHTDHVFACLQTFVPIDALVCRPCARHFLVWVSFWNDVDFVWTLL